MEEKKSKGCSYGLLIIVLCATIAFLTDYIVIDRKLRENSSGNVVDSNNTVIDDNGGSINTYETITQDELVGLLENQLYIFYGKKSLTDITNQNKLSLALHLMGNNDMGNLYDSITSSQLEAAFNTSIISNLGVKHENIIPSNSVLLDGNIGYGYTYSNGVYINPTTTNSGVSAVHMICNKVVSFKENDGKYVFSVKYLWGGFGEYLMDDEGVYGKYIDSISGQNSIGSVPEDILMGSYEELQNWGKDNFSRFEDKLEQYNFVFVKENGKISLVDFYVD